MNGNWVNYGSGFLFFLIALRDQWFPGRLEIHAGAGNPLLWFVMGCVCFQVAIARSRKEKNLALGQMPQK